MAPQRSQRSSTSIIKTSSRQISGALMPANGRINKHVESVGLVILARRTPESMFFMFEGHDDTKTTRVGSATHPGVGLASQE